MCNIVTGDSQINSVVLPDLESVIARLISLGKTYFQVQASNWEYLEVLVSGARCIVIYVRHGEDYLALNASKAERVSRERVELRTSESVTVVPASMCLEQDTMIEVVKKFCADGALSNLVYWLVDEPSQ